MNHKLKRESGSDSIKATMCRFYVIIASLKLFWWHRYVLRQFKWKLVQSSMLFWDHSSVSPGRIQCLPLGVPRSETFKMTHNNFKGLTIWYYCNLKVAWVKWLSIMWKGENYHPILHFHSTSQSILTSFSSLLSFYALQLYCLFLSHRYYQGYLWWQPAVFSEKGMINSLYRQNKQRL